MSCLSPTDSTKNLLKYNSTDHSICMRRQRETISKVSVCKRGHSSIVKISKRGSYHWPRLLLESHIGASNHSHALNDMPLDLCIYIVCFKNCIMCINRRQFTVQKYSVAMFCELIVLLPSSTNAMFAICHDSTWTMKRLFLLSLWNNMHFKQLSAWMFKRTNEIEWWGISYPSELR